MFKIQVGPTVENFLDWLQSNFQPLFGFVKSVIEFIMDNLEWLFLLLPSIILIILISALSWKLAGKKVAIFTFIGFVFIDAMGLWEQTMITVSMVLTSAIIALIIGVPVGIWASKNNSVDRVVRPILDFMQTMPAYVYMIPAVQFFDIGKVPGVIATIIFAMPPAVRLTNLGIRQVPKDVVEAARAFGSTGKQLLMKVQLPLATKTILAGVNQTIMLSLSMVVLSAMIGAKGLGFEVYNGITQLKIGQGFESGVAVVILAMVLDRITQALAKND
ncbi:MAG: ABC transporter permease [Eubacteriales bacterium]